MGVKLTARLKLDFEMDEGISANLAEARLKLSAAELQRFIELGHGNSRPASNPARPKSILWHRVRQLGDEPALPAAVDRRRKRRPTNGGPQICSTSADSKYC